MDFEPPVEEENAVPLIFRIFAGILVVWAIYYFVEFNGSFFSGKDTVDGSRFHEQKRLDQ